MLRKTGGKDRSRIKKKQGTFCDVGEPRSPAKEIVLVFWCFGAIGASNDRDTALGRANRAGRWGAVAGLTRLEGPVSASSFEELIV